MSKELRQFHYRNHLLNILEYLRLQQQHYYRNYIEEKIEDLELQQSDYRNTLIKQLSIILSSDNLRNIIFYFLDHGAATSKIFEYKLNLSESSIRWAIRRLRNMRLIVPAIQLPKDLFSKGGPRVKVWMLEEALPGQVRDAVILHQRLQSPKYRIALQVAQTLLDEYISKKPKKEITYREIVLQIKRLRIPFNTPDIADLTAQYLHEQGVRIWR